MPRFKLKAKDFKTYEILRKAVDDTVIIQKQRDLAYGRWDFVVFGELNKNETVLRVGFAEYSMIQQVPVYIASLGEPGLANMRGVPIEEFIADDIPDEYHGLQIYQVEPVRPLTVSLKKSLGSLGQVADKICKEYETQNIAIIQTPRDKDWMISVMSYLHQCDQHFPDRVQQVFYRHAMRGDLLSAPDGGYLN